MSSYRIDLQQLLDGLAAGPVPAVEIDGLSMDSRRLDEGEAFVALVGASRHGLDFVAAARAAGARALIHDAGDEPPADTGLASVAVPELGEKLPELARRMWRDPAAELDLVAVTGTNGKTSVAWLLAEALDGVMIGTLGSGRPGQLAAASHTTPDLLSVHALLAGFRDQGVTSVVMEASSHALAQGRLAGLSFASVIFTTLGHDHLDYHAGRSAYAAAKARLFTAHDSRRQLVNIDDAFGAELAAGLAGSPGLIRYALASDSRAEVTARVVEADLDGTRAAIVLPDGEIEVRSRLIGRVNLWNLLIVAAELHARGHTGASIARRIEALSPVPGRMQVLAAAGKSVLIDFAHTPDALRAVLESVRALAAGRLWCVFGCGGDRDRAKRPRMGRIAEALADRVVLTDDNPRGEDGLAIIREIQAGMAHPERCRVQRDRAAAITATIEGAERGDAVVVAGKGHESEQVIGDRRLRFSDRAVAEQALEAAA